MFQQQPCLGMWQQRNHPVKSLSPLDSQKKIWWCLLLEQRQLKNDYSMVLIYLRQVVPSLLLMILILNGTYSVDYHKQIYSVDSHTSRFTCGSMCVSTLVRTVQINTLIILYFLCFNIILSSSKPRVLCLHGV